MLFGLVQVKIIRQILLMKLLMNRKQTVVQEFHLKKMQIMLTMKNYRKLVKINPHPQVVSKGYLILLKKIKKIKKKL